MSYLSCGNCGSTNLTNEDGVLTCQSCGAEYAMDKSKLKSKEDKELEEEFYSFRKEERKKEILRLINVSKKGKSIGKILNGIFPGVGFIYLNNNILGIIFIAISSIIWLFMIDASLVSFYHEDIIFPDIMYFMFNFSYYYSSVFIFILILFMIVGYYSAGHVFEPNNTLTDQEVLKYAPDSKKAEKIRVRRI